MIKINGLKSIIQKGNEWIEKKRNEGWEETCDGWLSLDDIETSGLIYKQGNWFIPTQIYIAESSINGLKKGQKYLGVSKQYLDWKKQYLEKKYYRFESIDDKIEKEIELNKVNFT